VGRELDVGALKLTNTIPTTPATTTTGGPDELAVVGWGIG